jgi:hypothetical protein
MTKGRIYDKLCTIDDTGRAAALSEEPTVFCSHCGAAPEGWKPEIGGLRQKQMASEQKGLSRQAFFLGPSGGFGEVRGESR